MCANAACGCGWRRPPLAQELANVRSAEAELENARRNLIRTEIRAPYDGIVKLKNANIGQFISRGFNLGTIYGTDVAEVRLPLSDNDVGYLNMPGLTPAEQQQPEVLLSAEVAGQQLNWNARLVRTEGMLDDENRVIYAVAEIKDPYRLKADGQAPLRFGRFVRARIDGKNGDNLVLVERQTLEVDRQPILSQCGWTPFARRSFRHRVSTTIVSGQIAWREGRVNEGCRGLALRFMR